MTDVEYLDSAPIGRIFLLHSNPRHDPFGTEREAISYLCANEDVLPLARDIVKYGLNPLERCRVFPADKKKTGGSYFVAEGNRRICALAASTEGVRRYRRSTLNAIWIRHNGALVSFASS